MAPPAGVRGFSNALACDPARDYSAPPYALRRGEEHVLSRWNMERQRLTVSRMQCVVGVAEDGAAYVTSHGRGPSYWRESGGPWYALERGVSAPLADGDQVSLDWHDPEAAIFGCRVEAEERLGGGGPPGGWVALVDEVSGATYYYDEATGASQWEPPAAHQWR